jgi:curved DNA-binding protein
VKYNDYYKIMGLERNASQDDIKREYRKLARKFHPDVSKEPNAELRFKEVGEAYEVLKDPEKRAAYDQLGQKWKEGQEFKPPPDWQNGYETSGKGFTERDSAEYSDFFESLFRRGFSEEHLNKQQNFYKHNLNRNGEDSHAKIQIELEEAYKGGDRHVSLKIPELDAQGKMTYKNRDIEFKIPKGVRAGQHIRLAGQGSPGIGDGKPGDLYLEVNFKPHAHYRIDKHDVYLDLPVAPWEAVLGAEIEVPTPNGTVELKIPAGSIEGRKLRLKGRGIPSATPGDFYFVLNIVAPTAADEAGQAFYRRMAEQFKTFSPRAKLGA